MKYIILITFFNIFLITNLFSDEKKCKDLIDKPKFSEICDEFLEFIGNSALVIHNADFDISFINNELNLSGKNFEIKKFVVFLDYFSILILNYFLSPLIAFTVYFCFLHSIRHSISLAIDLDSNSLVNGFRLFVKKALPLTILTAIFSFIALYLLENSYNLDSAILKIIFIGLASLTFPHILLEYFLEKNEK